MTDRSANATPAEAEREVAAGQDVRSANDELRESRKSYRDLIGLLPTAVYTCDHDERVTLHNHAAVDLWGREPDRGRTCELLPLKPEMTGSCPRGVG